MNKSNITIPIIGFGTYPLNGNNLIDCLSVAGECGYQLIDTAYKYKNEIVIGDFIRNSHHQFIIESKLSLTQLQKKCFFGLFNIPVTPEKAFNNTLSNLGLQTLDIYLLHSPHNCIELYGDLIRLRDKGLVRVIGGCRMTISDLEGIYSRYGEYPSINQIEMHPYCSNSELVDFCITRNIVVEGRSPFAHGDLLEEFINDKVLSNIALKYSKTVPQIILRWITQKGVTAIPRSCNPAHIKENANIFDFKLDDDELTMIDSLNRNQSMGCLSAHQANK